MTWTMIKQNEELEIRNQKKKLFGEELEKINKRVITMFFFIKHNLIVPIETYYKII